MGDAKFASAQFGAGLTALGDFDGDGVPDFAVGAPRYETNRGYVAVIYGSSAFANRTLPADYGAGKALGIQGDTASGFFGLSLVGLGKLFPTGRTLVASAHGASKTYAFEGRLGANTPIGVAAADDTYTGVAGRNSGFALSIAGSSGGVPVLGLGAPHLAGTLGSATLFFGNTTGPFKGTSVTYTSSTSTVNGDGFGVAVIGGGFSGTDVLGSVIGSSEPDVILASIKENGALGSTLYFLDGSQAFASGNIVSLAHTSYKLPADWLGVSRTSRLIRDVNNDGYADIVIGEYKAGTAYQGRVLVLW